LGDSHLESSPAQEAGFEYVGDELGVFKYATNWKRYWGSKIRSYLGSNVLEVGAGIGGTTAVLGTSEFDSWTGIEPDAAMINDLKRRQEAGEFGSNISFREATVQDLAGQELFDSIIYIDVLEHIEHDKQELEDASRHLHPGGHLIVLSPAFAFLYTPFDKAIGHFRRYTRHALAELTPPQTQVVRLFYLDSIGMLASISNLLLLRASMPTRRQILLWDRAIIPVSRWIDPLVGYQFGRSVIGIWKRNE